MNHGFVKVAAATPSLRVADCVYNTDQMLSLMENAARSGARLLVFPALSITCYTFGALFLQRALL